jgi:hypothetical protein
VTGDNSREFEGRIARIGSQVGVALPFEPDEAWGKRARHDIAGTINGVRVRGPLRSHDGRAFVSLGQAWRRDSGLKAGDAVRVVIWPEGPQQANLPGDIAAAFEAEPEARTFFESIPTFYRRNYMRWIESAKRPETRANRIRETMDLLKAGRREK